MLNNNIGLQVTVVVPAYRVTNHILQVLKSMPDIVSKIFVIDDACPDGSGKLVEAQAADKRISVLYLPDNQGVGGAVMAGYAAAM